MGIVATVRNIKAQYPGHLVVSRVGDFYEAFDGDARTMAEVCNLIVTSRPIGPGERVPMSGFPYHVADRYLAMLIAHGHKVALVEPTGQKLIEPNTCPDCGAKRKAWDNDWDGDLDNPPAWALDCDPERCNRCGALLED